MNAERGADGQLPAMSPADHQRLSRPSMLPSRLSSIVIALLALLTVTPAVRASDADVAFGRLLEHCHIPAGAVADLQGRELFEATLARLDVCLNTLREIPDAVLPEPRPVGRGELPSTVRGLLFHAAEHTTMHVGQIRTTLKVIRGLA